MKFSDTDVFKLILEENNSDPYKNSSLKKLKSLSSKKKGKYFEALTQEFYKNMLGSSVRKPENSEHDRIIDERKKEIKGSFLWGTGTHFRWQQIRVNQDYDDVVFVAAYPDRIEFYEADSNTVKEMLEVQDSDGSWIYNQHGGKKVNSGTFVIDGFPSDFPWMNKIGVICAK